MKAMCRKCPSLKTAHLAFYGTGGESEIKAHSQVIEGLWEVYVWAVVRLIL